MIDRVEIRKDHDHWLLSCGHVNSRVRVDPAQARQYQYTDVFLSSMAAELHDTRARLAMVEERLNAEMSKRA